MHFAHSRIVPDDILNVVLSFLTGFDLLQLSHTDPDLYRDGLSDDSDVWRDRSDQEQPCPQDVAWLAWLNPKDPQDPTFKAKYKKFVGGVKSSPRTVTKKPPSLRRECSWKKFYFSSFSFHFRGSEICAPMQYQRGSAVEVPASIHSSWATAEGFSFDIWFALAPSSAQRDARSGGVLLGAQSIHWIDNWWPEYHGQIAHVDPEGNLYCTMTAPKKIVARKLQAETWYHLVLTYYQGIQKVYLNGVLIDASHGQIQTNWGRMQHLQLGTGCMSGTSLGSPAPDFRGWYGFNGLLNECRFWKGELSSDQVTTLTKGNETAVCDQVECVWSLKQDVDASFYGRVACVRSTRPQERICSDLSHRFHFPGPAEPFEPRPIA